jgi:hypothetical protein
MVRMERQRIFHNICGEIALETFAWKPEEKDEY